MKQALGALGVTGGLALGGAALVLGAAVIAWERRRGIRPPLRARWFGWLVAESLVYAVALAALVGRGGGTSGVLGRGGAPCDDGALAAGVRAGGMSSALSLGAGLYEELVFRVVLVGGLAWGLRRLWGRSDSVGNGGGHIGAYAVAAVVGALLFSWSTTSARSATCLRSGRFCFGFSSGSR